MSTTDGTMPLGSYQENSQEQPRDPQKNNTTAAAAGVTGVAAAGLGAAGIYAYNEYNKSADEELEIILDDEELLEDPNDEVEVEIEHNPAVSHNTSVNRTSTGAPQETTTTPPSTHQTQTPPAHTPGTPATPINQTTEPPVEQPTTPTSPTSPTQPVEQPVNPPVEQPVEPIDPVVNPQIEVAEDPDDIAEALISVEEIDPEDFDGTQPFAFTSVETVYDIDGNATTSAEYIDQNGMTGVMVDLDGDGVFDILTEDTGAMYTIEDSETFLTVGDAEYDVETGYIAYDENQDTMIDDDPMDDIIDTEDFA
ncbi:MAG: hypothetical protein NC405_03305 [Odoribacter sp.]|nr:hypothetical protein [Odoribacter sp.]